MSSTVDPDADAAGRRHAVLERHHEILVERMSLLVAGEPLRHLLLELRPLLDRIGQLREGRAELHPTDDDVEVLREPRVGAMRPGERRDLPREVADERRSEVSWLPPASRTSPARSSRRPMQDRASHVVSGRHLGEVRAIQRDLLSGDIGDGTQHRDTAEGCGEVQLAFAEREGERTVDGERARPDQILGDPHHRLVVAVRLVQLEHRELRVVLAVDALVAEVPADLVDALEATHQQPLQVQLQGDPQLEVRVERVVIRRERLRQRAAGHGLQDRASRPRCIRDRPAHGGSCATRSRAPSRTREPRDR